MWIGEDTPIAVSRIGKNAFGFQLIDEVSNLPIDMTNMTIRFNIADYAGGTSFVGYPAIVPSDPVNGGFDWIVDGQDLNGVPGEAENVVFFYNGYVNDGGSEYLFIRGPITIMPGV